MVTSISTFAFFTFLKRAGWPALVLVPALALLTASPSHGGVIYTGSSVVFSGTAAGGQAARATFTVSASNSNVLELFLENTSLSPTMSPAELLTSVYFNVLSGTTTGTPAPLTYQNATGQVYLTMKNMPDRPASYVPPNTVTYPNPPQPSNLQAFVPNDDTWQFKSGLALVASSPPLAFGVGTVGNSSLTPNNFNGNIVNGFDFGIYKGDVTTQNLDNTLLVKNSAMFEFAGFGGFNLAQVSPHAVFGFGTNPDCIISVPEPGTLSLATFGLLVALVTLRRRRESAPEASVQGTNALEIRGA
jgi:hypothetical protein